MYLSIRFPHTVEMIQESAPKKAVQKKVQVSVQYVEDEEKKGSVESEKCTDH